MPRSLTEVAPQLAAVRAILLLATLAGLLTSWPIWTNTRAYPLLPVAGWIPLLPAPWDKVLTLLTLGSLVAAFWRYRPAVVSFLICALLLYGQDQNRGQPWLYMYWVMLALSLGPAPAALAACQFAVSAVYFWSGLQKCNANFFQIIPEWFASPATAWGLPASLTHALQWAVASAPVTEIVVAIAVWLPRTRWIALAVIALIHGAALLFLGPLGHQYNWVIWPWNLAMASLAWALFGHTLRAEVRPAWNLLRSCRAGLVTVMLFTLLPLLSYWGWWNSYFSFALYSANLATADVLVTERVRDQWPPRLQAFVRPVRQPQPPPLQGSMIFDYTNWTMQELGVPPVPEPRSYLAMFRYLQTFSTPKEGLTMILQPRRGPLVLYQGDKNFELRPNPTP